MYVCTCVFDHSIFIIDYAEPGRLATCWMHGALFRHCVDGAAGRTESGDNSLFNLVQSEDEILCFHGDSLVQEGTAAARDSTNCKINTIRNPHIIPWGLLMMVLRRLNVSLMMMTGIELMPTLSLFSII